MPQSILPGTKAPALDVKLIIGTQWELSEQTPDFMTMIVVFRGKHCPICKGYLQELSEKLAEFVDQGVAVIAVSMETEDRTQAIWDEWETGDLPLGWGMTRDQAREWGVFVSEKIKDGEPDVFAEPAVFWVQPDGTLYYSNVANMPFGRPGIDAFLKRIDFVKENDYPPRGTLALD